MGSSSEGSAVIPIQGPISEPASEDEVENPFEMLDKGRGILVTWEAMPSGEFGR